MMELRILLESPLEPHSPTNGLVWHKNGMPRFKAILQFREEEGPHDDPWWGEWKDVPVTEDRY